MATAQTFDKNYDVVVIGAGPAGLNACLHLLTASPQPSVLMLDKMVPWERPMPCAEGVGRLGFTEAILPDPSWIRHSISKAVFHSPGGACISYGDYNKGFIIDRSRMQGDLAQRCREGSAHVILDTRATAVSRPGPSGGRTVQVGDAAVTARIVIDASGPLSPFGKGEEIAWKPIDLEPAYFALLDNVEHENDAVHIHVGRGLAPGGYAWVFPNQDRTVNVGVLVGSGMGGSVNIRQLLDGFVRQRFAGARVVRHFAGSIPCGYRRGSIAVDGLIKAGDSASTINPISRAGIVEAMMSGALAGDYALSMLGCQTARDMTRLCREYERAWYEKRGKRHEKLARVKKDLASIPDADYNVAAEALQGLQSGNISMGLIFRKAVGRFPKLVWALRHLM